MRKLILVLILASILGCTLTQPRAARVEPAALVSTGEALAPAAPPTTEYLKCVVHTGISGGWVNVRTCASTNCEIVAILPDGLLLKVLAFGDWTLVSAGSRTGYIYSLYCERK